MGYPIQLGAATGVSQRAFLSPISDARHQQQCGDRSPVCTSDSRRYTLSRNSHVDAIARDYPPPRERERVGYTYYDDEEPWAHLYAEAAFLSAKRASMVREGERIRHEAEESVIQMAADASVHKGSVVTSATFDRLLSPQPRLSPSARSHSRAKTAECPTDGSACGAAALHLENGAGSPASPLAINAYQTSLAAAVKMSVQIAIARPWAVGQAATLVVPPLQLTQPLGVLCLVNWRPHRLCLPQRGGLRQGTRRLAEAALSRQAPRQVIDAHTLRRSASQGWTQSGGPTLSEEIGLLALSLPRRVALSAAGKCRQPSLTLFPRSAG